MKVMSGAARGDVADAGAGDFSMLDTDFDA